MKIELDCLSCIFRQTLEAARMAADDEKVVREIIDEYARLVPDIDKNSRGPEVVAEVQNIIKDKTGVKDPYHDFKNDNIKSALIQYPRVKEILNNNEDSLLAALIMSAMGNSIDAGVSLEVDLETSISKAVEEGFIRSDYSLFKEKLKNSQDILIIADNAGEAIFDKLLIKELKKYEVNITYAVREEPVLNDITLREAEGMDLGKECNLISSGCKSPGIIMEDTSDQFKNIMINLTLELVKDREIWKVYQKLKKIFSFY